MPPRWARARRQSTPTASSAACVGVEQLTAATSSSSVRSVWWPTEAITGTPSSATVRQRVSSQKHSRSASEPPPRATIATSTSPTAARSCSAAGDRWSGVAVLDRGETPHNPARPAAPAQSREHVVARLAALTRHDPDRVWQQRPRQAPLALQQALGGERLAQALDPRQQVPLARDAQVAHLEGEARRGAGAAGVVVAAAGHHHLHPLPHGPGAAHHRLPILPPRRARDRAVGVAQLEVHPCARRAQVGELAHELHSREGPQPRAQRRRVLPDSVRARYRAAAMPSKRGVVGARGSRRGGIVLKDR